MNPKTFNADYLIWYYIKYYSGLWYQVDNL